MISTNANVESWKSNVPESWSIIPLKFITSYNDEKLSELSDPDLIFDYIDIGSVSYENGIETVQRCCFKDAPSRARRVVRENDVILSTVRTYLKAGAIIPEHDRLMIVSTGFITIRAKETILSQYLKYLILSHGFVSEVECRSYGSNYPAINPVEIENITVPLPDIKSQESITSFLDARCSSIDSAISKHQQIIEKLEEYRKAVITQAVTKGLNPNAKMDDDHHEGLGAIPTHWKYERIKYLFTIRKRIAGEEGYTVLSITQHGIVPKDIDSNKGQIAADYSDYQLVYAGDFAMNHMDLLTGWVDISNYDGVTSPDYRVFTINDETRNDKRYFKYLLQMCYFNRIFYRLGAGISGMGRWRLQAPAFNNFKFPVPPLAEQAEIANYIDHVSETIDTAVSQHNQLISKLQEYKQSLIYNAVTGKIDCTVEAKA